MNRLHDPSLTDLLNKFMYQSSRFHGILGDLHSEFMASFSCLTDHPSPPNSLRQTFLNQSLTLQLSCYSLNRDIAVFFFINDFIIYSICCFIWTRVICLLGIQICIVWQNIWTELKSLMFQAWWYAHTSTFTSQCLAWSSIVVRILSTTRSNDKGQT